MYFVDRSTIDEKLVYMDKMIQLIEKTQFSSKVDYIALERMAHVLIEAVLDVGNMMIDGFIMRDPGSYEDIIDILIDEKVIPKQEGQEYKRFINLRRNLVIDYINVNHVYLEEELNECIDTLKGFSTHIRTYLTNALGVANAFLNTENK